MKTEALKDVVQTFGTGDDSSCVHAGCGAAYVYNTQDARRRALSCFASRRVALRFGGVNAASSSHIVTDGFLGDRL